jgi:hypothetical protein
MWLTIYAAVIRPVMSAFFMNWIIKNHTEFYEEDKALLYVAVLTPELYVIAYILGIGICIYETLSCKVGLHRYKPTSILEVPHVLQPVMLCYKLDIVSFDEYINYTNGAVDRCENCGAIKLSGKKYIE